MAEARTFRGTAGQLLKELGTAATFKGNSWPNSPRALSERLRRDAKLLPEIDMEFGIKEGHNRNRLIVANLKPCPELPQETNSEAPKLGAKPNPGSRRKEPVRELASANQLGLFVGG